MLQLRLDWPNVVGLEGPALSFFGESLGPTSPKLQKDITLISKSSKKVPKCLPAALLLKYGICQIPCQIWHWIWHMPYFSSMTADNHFGTFWLLLASKWHLFYWIWHMLNLKAHIACHRSGSFWVQCQILALACYIAWLLGMLVSAKKELPHIIGFGPFYSRSTFEY